jgi:hypothetical protein
MPDADVNVVISDFYKVTPAMQERRFITAYRRSPKDSQPTLDVWIYSGRPVL